MVTVTPGWSEAYGLFLEGEAEMVALSGTEFVVPVAPGVRIAFERTPAGEVTGMVATLGGRTIRARRLPE